MGRLFFMSNKLNLLLSLLMITACASQKKVTHEEAQLEANVVFQLGLSSLKNKENISALRLFQQAESIYPANPSYKIHQALVYDRLEQYEKAEAILREVCQKNLDTTECKNSLSSVLINKKNYEEAIQLSLEVIQDQNYLTPELAWANMARAQMYLGNEKEALVSVNNSLRLNENLCNVQNLKIKILMRNLNYQAALEEVQKTTMKCPRYWPSHAWEAYMFFKIGAKKVAHDKLEQINKNFTINDAKIYSYMSLKRLEQGRAFEEPQI